jgi:hypothetical protein
MNQPDSTPTSAVHSQSSGPWPFISQHIVPGAENKHIVLNSRHHRKGFYRAMEHTGLLRCLWMPGQLNWWIGIGFSLGALLFALGCVMVLSPSISSSWPLRSISANTVFFAGSIPFTIAAYLQLFQAANAGEFTPQLETVHSRRSYFGWYPHQIGWLGCALQFLGTLLFNINTFEAMLPKMNWLQQDFAIWIPDLIGSMLFLLSGYLAFIETCHRYWAWRPRDISWWVTFISVLGCVAFMISALFSYVPQTAFSFDAATIAVMFTLIGAICFFIGSMLMLPETALSTKSDGLKPVQGNPVTDKSSAV